MMLVVPKKFLARCSTSMLGSLFHRCLRLVGLGPLRLAVPQKLRVTSGSTEVFGLLFYKSFGSLFHRSFAPDMYPGTEASVRSYTVVFGSFSNFTSNIDSEYGDPTISR